MPQTTQDVQKIASFVVSQMFQVQPDEMVVVTSDDGANHAVVDAIAAHAHQAGGKVVVMRTPLFKGRVTLVDASISAEFYTAALAHADIWIDANQHDFLYSGTWNRIMAANQRLRYLLLGDLSTEILGQLFGGFDVPTMLELCDRLKVLIEAGSHMRVTNPQGTDITYALEPAHLVAVDCGAIKTHGLYTPPALVNIVPRFGSANGVIVFDAVYDAYPDKQLSAPLTLTVENSEIVAAHGNQYAEQFMLNLDNATDRNARKVAHMNFGLLPTIRALTGYVVVDERVWGVTNWGFGSVSPVDAPPNGQPSGSHFDAICTQSSVWIDDVPIAEDGHFVHPSLAKVANDLLVS